MNASAQTMAAPAGSLPAPPARPDLDTLPLEPLAGRADHPGQESEAKGRGQERPLERPRETRAAQPRRRPLARFTETDEGPNFYLSLSDLMCLMMVFFVLIFSLTDTKAAFRPDAPPPAKIQPGPKVVKGSMPFMLKDPFPNPEPLPAQVGMAVLGVSSGGQGDPGLVAKGAGAGQPYNSEQPGKAAQGAPLPSDAWPPPEQAAKVRPFDPLLMGLVAKGAPLPAAGLPDGETSLAALLGQGSGVEVEQDGSRILLRLPEQITFDLGRAEIKPGMVEILGRLAQVLERHPEVPVVVTGHTDDLPIHNEVFASNWELSAARAAAVGRALMAQGLEQERFSIRGLADRQPRLPNRDEVSRSQNRRVEIELRLAS